MNTIRTHVRGQMGVQILQAFTALSSINADEEPIICVCSGGLTYDGTNKLGLVFNTKCRVIDIDDIVRKTPYWVDGAATKIFENRDNIFRWLQPKSFPTKENLDVAVHIRGKDKPTVSKKSYRYLVDEVSSRHDNVIAYTDDKDFADTLLANTPNIRTSTQSVIDDWADMYNSQIVYSSPSAFIMSMLLINPNKHVVILGDKYCDGGYPHFTNDLLFIREAKQFCPNMEIWDE